MEINERVVIKYPESLYAKKPKSKGIWIRHRLATELINLRRKVLKEKGVDIFNLFVMTDCFEFTLKGDIEAGVREELRPNKKGTLY